MTRQDQEFDDGDEDDGPAESEWPDESDTDDSVDTRPCPNCGESIYEQAERCPNCGSYVSKDHSGGRKPLWIVLGVIIALAAVLFCWVLR